MDEIEAELRRERENGNRLAATLEMLVRSLPHDGETLHAVLGDPRAANHLTVGHVVDGALAAHAAAVKTRVEL